MVLVTSTWSNTKTFKLIPIDNNSPFNEGIYDLNSKVLALIGKERKQSMHMIAKLTDMGDVLRLKIGKRENGKDYAEERKSLETFYEYYVEDINEVKEIVNMLAINADTFDITSFVETKTEAPKTGNLITTV
jgi:hypothetical protein